MHHPVIAIVVTVAILVAASLPYFTIETGQSGVSSLPQGSSPRVAFEILDEEFSAGGIQPALVAVEAADVSADAVQSATDELVALLGADAAFGEAEVVTNRAGTVLQVSVPVQGDSQEDEAREAVMRLREEYGPAAFAGVDAEVNVTGYTARILDYSDMINRYTPWVFVWVLGLSFVILLVVFRSIVVPIKALIMNLLSVGAAYGLMVLVFQHGVGADLLGFNQVDRIEAWVPLFLFAILFGLSMDYHVFLLSRIRERYDETHSNRESVAFGIRSTAGMITGAAAIMVAVFSGFALGELVMFQQMGFGLAVAVFLDATIIRVVLVPASMALLGDANWYLPSWLSWLPKLDIEGRAHAHAEGAAAVASEA
jgi:RND superfamily putative drug exporter